MAHPIIVAEPGRRLTHDDVLEFNPISDAQISPDGTHILYVVSQEYVVYPRTLPKADIWITSVAGSETVHQLTDGSSSDVHPRWSPDGSMLAFLSDRTQPNVRQLYVLTMETHEARQLTNLPNGVQSFQWSRRGDTIAILAKDPPPPDSQQRLRLGDDAIQLDHNYRFTRLWNVPVVDGECLALSRPSYQVRTFCWLDETCWAVAVSATPKEEEVYGGRAWSILKIWDDGTEQVIWHAPFSIPTLVSRPDGKALAWLHTGADHRGRIIEVWMCRNGQQPTRLLADHSGTLCWLRWLANDDVLLAGATQGTQTVVFRLLATTGMSEPVLTGLTISKSPFEFPQISFSENTAQYACVLDHGTFPGEVWVGQFPSLPHQITHTHLSFENLHLGPCDVVVWRASDGTEIEGIVIYPPDYQPGRRYPLFVQPHGGPNWQWLERFMAGWREWGQLFAARGYVVLLPNPRGSTGRGSQFASQTQSAWGVNDLGDVISGVDELIARGVADPERLCIGGWSYGGYLAMWAITQTPRFRAAIVGSGMTNLTSFLATDIPGWLVYEQMLYAPWENPPLYSQCSPIVHVARVRTPTLILHGANDQRVPLSQSLELYHSLRLRDVPVEMVIYPREGHQISEYYHQRDVLNRVTSWCDRWIGLSDTL